MTANHFRRLAVVEDLPVRDHRSMSADIAEFLEWLERRNYSEQTLAQYRSVLGRAAIAFDLECASAKVIEWWLAELGIKPISQVTYLTPLRSFYRWSQSRGRRTDNPAALVAAPRLPGGLPRPLTPPEVHHAIETAPTPRLGTWLRLGALAGLRVSEIANIRAGGFDSPGRVQYRMFRR